MPDQDFSFRVNTPQFLKEVFENGARMAIFKIPANVFQTLLAQVAQRATELKDPILDKLMFDLALYEEGNQAKNKDYGKTMKLIYAAAKKQLEKEKQLTTIK